MKKSIFIILALVAFFNIKVSAQTYQSDFGWLSDTKLTNSDLLDRAPGELTIMKNAIYAKYGYAFQGGDMYEYFSQFPWYEATTMNEAFVYAQMTPVEQYNVGLIKLMGESEGSVISVQYGMSYPSWLITRRLTMNDIRGWSCWDLRVYRNAIYAVNGYIFKSDDLREIFYSCGWYRPNTKSDRTAYNRMSSTEKANVDLMKKREKQLGCR